MRLENQFTIPVPIDDAWSVVRDLERVAPCMPGASLEEVDGDVYRGSVKVKIGPISITYQGEARLIEQDEQEHLATFEARGREARGSGIADARVTARLRPEGSITHATVLTDLDVTGRPAQFGRGVMVDVAGRLVDEFSANLAVALSGSAGSATVPGSAAGASESLDLMRLAGGPLLRRLLLAVATLTGVAALLRLLRRHR